MKCLFSGKYNYSYDFDCKKIVFNKNQLNHESAVGIRFWHAFLFIKKSNSKGYFYY